MPISFNTISRTSRGSAAGWERVLRSTGAAPEAAKKGYHMVTNQNIWGVWTVGMNNVFFETLAQAKRELQYRAHKYPDLDSQVFCSSQDYTAAYYSMPERRITTCL